VKDQPGWTVAMGPVGTTRIQWIHRNGSIGNNAADHTMAMTEYDDVTSVRFLDANGTVIGTREVLEPFGRYSEVLPEVGPDRN
jgi:hypothetical protein